MKRVLGILLTLSLMAGMMTMPAFAQGEAKKGAPAAEKKDGKQGDAKKSDKKAAKKGDKTDKKATAKKGDKKAEKTEKK